MSESKAMEIAGKLTKTYRSRLRNSPFTSENELYNEAYVVALTQRNDKLGWTAARYAVLRLICNRIHSSSRRVFQEKDQAAIGYRRMLLAEQRRTQDSIKSTELRMDLVEAFKDLSPLELDILKLRVIIGFEQRAAATQLNISEDKLRDKEHFACLKLSRALSDWRTEK